MPGAHCFLRGAPVSVYDRDVRYSLEVLASDVDCGLAQEIWEAALAACEVPAKPVWFHGDVADGNLLVRDGRLSAVIDFGCSGVGDAACDMYIAWTMFRDAERRRFKAVLGIDASSWARGRGWVLWKALIRLALRDEEAPDWLAVLDQVFGEYRTPKVTS